MTSISKIYGLLKGVSSCNRASLILKGWLLPSRPDPNYHQYRTLIGTVKHYSKKEKPLSSTSVIVQDGVSILEMPCIVQVINGDFEILSNGKTDGGDSYVGMGLHCHHVPKSLIKNIDFAEESEMALGFMRCNSMKDVFNLLNTCPEAEITPAVALAVIRRVFELENNVKFRNEGYNLQMEDTNLTFTRSALMRRLVEIICASTEPQVIVDTLRSMGRDPNKRDNWNYLEQLCNESIILASDGKLNVNQVCEVIKSFQSLGDVGKEFAEKAWVGINEKQQINEDDICDIISILPSVKNSRMYLYNIVERKVPLIWHKLNTDHIIKIAYLLVQLKISSSRLLGLISRWTNLNIHTLTEGNLKWIVYTCLYLEYSDENIQKALSRYMKVKKENIQDSSLVFTILEYCNKLRIKHPTILSSGSEYFIKHGKNIPACNTSIIMNCFGNLAFIPDRAYEFFHVIEHQINTNFSQFPPGDLLDIFLSCIYIKRYPLNFVNKVFDSYFFDRILALDDKNLLSCREKLMIMDTVLTLESSAYNGPLLPKAQFSELSIVRNVRAMRCINKIKPFLTEIFGNGSKISLCETIPSLPPISLFGIDCVVEASEKISFSNFRMKKSKYAFLILLPEHFDITGTHLLGPHALRKRMIEYFDFKIVGLRFNTVNKLMMYPEKLIEYIKTEMFQV